MAEKNESIKYWSVIFLNLKAVPPGFRNRGVNFFNVLFLASVANINDDTFFQDQHYFFLSVVVFISYDTFTSLKGHHYKESKASRISEVLNKS